MPANLPMSSLTEAIVETITKPLLVLDGELRVEAANRAFLQHFGVESAESLGCLVYDLGNGQWNIAELRQDSACHHRRHRARASAFELKGQKEFAKS